ncbi:MAG: hypothetical protein HKO62_00840, partial [Gammaproteobacteria bacterium]|nr:hypothetical protein [Gammaproteobacteria bacterium]
YASAGVYDGIPGDPGDPYGPHVRLDSGDGVFAIAESGLLRDTPAGPAKFAAGAWHSTARFDDVAGQARAGNRGAYLIAEVPLPVAALPGELGAFAQLGVARSDRNAIHRYLGAGVHWRGPLGHRPDDAMSIGVAHARLSDSYRRVLGRGPRAETAVEVTYAWQLTEHIALQPDLQVIVDPALAADIPTAVVIGARIIIALP